MISSTHLSRCCRALGISFGSTKIVANMLRSSYRLRRTLAHKCSRTFFRRTSMRRPVPVRARTLTSTLILTLAGASLIGVPCPNDTPYDPANGRSASSRAEDTVEQGLEALRNFCGNGKCDHHETCSTCAADCGTCPPPPPPVTACNSTGSPPAAYQHIVIFSFE